MSQYHEVFVNGMRKSFEKVFFAKLLGIKHLVTSPSVPPRYMVHFYFPVPPRYKFISKTFFLENIDTILATWPFNRPYPRTRLFRIVLTMQRCTHSQDPVNPP